MYTRFICTICGRFEDVTSSLQRFAAVTNVVRTTCIDCQKGH